MKIAVSICLVALIVIVGAALPVPTTITFTSVQSRQVTLFVQFSDASASGKRLSVTFTSPGGHTVTGDATISGGFATLSLSGLLPGTTYTVRAFVVDGSNKGQAKVSTVTTAVDVPSGPVRGLKTSSISSRSVTLTWNLPEASDINSPNGLTGYYVELRRFERNRCEGRLQSTTTKARKRQVTFNNLQPVTAYCVVVFPENEGGRARELHVTSGRHTFTTSGEAPSDSPTLTIVQPQFTQLTLAWSEPSQPNGVLTQYIIQYRMNRGNWNEISTTALSRYKVLSSVFESGRRYQLRMAAVNAHGRGPFSTAVGFTMQPPVYDIKFCRLSTSSAKLIWKLHSQPSLGAQLLQLRFSFSSSGQPIKRYSVNKSASGHVVTGLASKVFQLSVGLVWSERERLYFQSDDKDLGPLQTVPNCYPSQPRNLERESVNPKGFTLTWSEPSTPNGQISKYIITVKSRDSRLPYEETFERVSNRLTVNGLEEAVQYRVRVRAVNEFEEGPTVGLSVTTRDSVPTGPALNIEVERISTTAVSVTWEAPAYEDINAVGGITGYSVVIGSRCNQDLTSSETTNLRVVFDNLEPGSSYCVRVFPLNNVGVTPNNIVRNSAVRVELPDVLPPPVPVGQTVECTHAVIVWKEVESNDEENPITNYVINITNSNKVVSLPPGSVYYNMTGLSPGSTYTVKVAAKNGMGVGWNATFTITTLLCACNNDPEKAPNKPVQNVIIKRINNTAVGVTWDPPPMTRITQYRVVIGNKGCRDTLHMVTVNGNTNTAKFGGLEPSSSYCVRVYPTNEQGSTPERIAKRSRRTIDLPDLLPAPRLAGAAAGPNAALLWEEVESNDEENPVINYVVHHSHSRRAVILPHDTFYYHMLLLPSGRRYTVTVAAQNALGVGRNASFTFTTT